MKAYGTAVAAVLRSLLAFGPQTSRELSESTGINPESLRSIVSRMHKASSQSPKRIYVSRWVDFVEGTRTYTRAEYSIGDCEDARKRRRTGAETQREFRRRNKRRLMLSRNPTIAAAAGMWAGLIS